VPQALRLDWRLGLRWFESCLCDHDWAVNLGNWAYNAGGHCARVPCCVRSRALQCVSVVAARGWLPGAASREGAPRGAAGAGQGWRW
jgi:hypothetical protein